MRKMMFQFSEKGYDDIFISMEYHVYWLLKSSIFEIFRERKHGLFTSQIVDGNMIFIDYWKVLVLSFSVMRNFLQPKRSWKNDIYWLHKSSCFELFGDGKQGFFLSQKVEGKIIFPWSFWTFHGIPGLGIWFFLQCIH